MAGGGESHLAYFFTAKYFLSCFIDFQCAKLYIKEINFKKFLNSLKISYGAFLFSVQKVDHNYDLNPKFEQKNFKNEDGNSNSISKGKMAGIKSRKK